MKLKPIEKNVLAILSFYPLVYTILSLISFVGAFATSGRLSEAFGGAFRLLGYLEVPTLLILVGLIIGYVKLALKQEDKTDNKRVDLAAAIIFFNVFSIPYFWYRYIRNIESE